MNTEEVCKEIIQSIRGKVSHEKYTDFFLSHPYSNTALAISDFFLEQGIQTSSYLIKRQDIKLLKDCTPFIIQVKSENNKLFGIVYNIDVTTAFWYNPIKNRKENISISLLQKLFSGFVLIIDTTKTIAHKPNIKSYIRDFFNKDFTFMIYSLMTLSSLVFILRIYPTFSFNIIINFILIAIGVFICLSIINYENGESIYLKKICHKKKTIDCDSIIHSQGSKVFGVHLSSIGLSYFLGLLLICAINSTVVLNSLLWIYLLSSIFIIYSLYYQIILVKKICTMCMSIIVINIGLAVNLFFVADTSFNIKDIKEIGSVIICMYAAFILIQTYINGKYKNKEFKREKYTLTRLKNRKDIFMKILMQQRKIESLTDNIGIVFGPSTAEYKITIITNPCCYWCKELHKEIHNLLWSRSNIKIQIIFNVPSSSSNMELEVSRAILGSAASPSTYYASNEILDFWFEKSYNNLSLFKKRFIFPKTILEAQDNKINEMYFWCKSEKLYTTPSIFINGFLMPDEYELKEVLYMI